jgi:hypothetical protein
MTAKEGKEERIGGRVQVGEREDKVGFFPSEDIPVGLEQKCGGKAEAAKEAQRKSQVRGKAKERVLQQEKLVGYSTEEESPGSFDTKTEVKLRTAKTSKEKRSKSVERASLQSQSMGVDDDTEPDAQALSIMNQPEAAVAIKTKKTSLVRVESIAKETGYQEKSDTVEATEAVGKKTAEIRKAVSSAVEQAVQQVKSLGLSARLAETADQCEGRREQPESSASSQEEKRPISRACLKSKTVGVAAKEEVPEEFEDRLVLNLESPKQSKVQSKSTERALNQVTESERHLQKKKLPTMRRKSRERRQ